MCLAIPAKIIELFPDDDRALVDVSGVRRRIEIGLLRNDPPKNGDWVLVHVGFALNKVSYPEAQDRLDALRRLYEDSNEIHR